MAQNAQKVFPKLVAMCSDRKNHHRENSVNSNQSEDEGVYDSIARRPHVLADEHIYLAGKIELTPTPIGSILFEWE